MFNKLFTCCVRILTTVCGVALVMYLLSLVMKVVTIECLASAQPMLVATLIGNDELYRASSLMLYSMGSQELIATYEY